MSTPLSQIPVGLAWEPLPREQWDIGAARHLLNRAGFCSPPDLLDWSLRAGPAATVDHLFAGSTEPDEIPGAAELRERIDQLRQQARQTEDREEKRAFWQKIRETQNEYQAEYQEAWMRRLTRIEQSATEKWLLFLEDLWVVGFQKIRRDTEFLGAFRDTIRTHGTDPYPDLCKRLSREPAMMLYLDLVQNKKDHPNENFARELLELFTLGEGNYTEDDIREAARAFTGYRLAGRDFRFQENQHDSGNKTVFGQTGPWGGDDVIDLIFEQKAASTFLPGEMVRYYLTRDPLPDPSLELLGSLWKAEGFDLGRLRKRFFTSRMFYANEYRGRHIRSPLELYTAALQLLRLEIVPFPNQVNRGFRNAGQNLFEPPNVRGWIGGTHWINSSKLRGRRQMIASLFRKINEEKLNADDLARLEEARREDRGPFYLQNSYLEALSERDVDAIVDLFCHRFLAVDPAPAWEESLRDHLLPRANPDQCRTALQTLMQTPEFQLS